MTAYYNEIEPYAAQWLRNLIGKGLIAHGEVDTRSIVDVQPDDLRGFDQCHFFAGIGGWSYAARLAGWPDDRPLWTGSAPCQPFSVAGKGKAQEDERHLWPVFFELIRACRPPVLMGEQVAAAVGKDWLDGVCADLEGVGYACGATVVPACAVDAPHRRDRLWFVADANGERSLPGAHAGIHCSEESAGPRDVEFERHSVFVSGRGGDADSPLDYAQRAGLEGYAGHGDDGCGWPDAAGSVAATGGAVSDADCIGIRGERRGAFDGAQAEGQGADGERERVRTDAGAVCASGSAWSGAEWAIGADGKARRVKSGVRLLAHGVPARVGRLRAYGNAIVPQVAAEVIVAFMESRP